MATAFAYPAPSISSEPLSMSLTARVGGAEWTAVLSPPALDMLRAGMADAASTLGDDAIARIMAAVRAKAVALHWYGGGVMDIEPEDLSAAKALTLAQAGTSEATGPWFEIIEID